MWVVSADGVADCDWRLQPATTSASRPAIMARATSPRLFLKRKHGLVARATGWLTIIATRSLPVRAACGLFEEARPASGRRRPTGARAASRDTRAPRRRSHRAVRFPRRLFR